MGIEIILKKDKNLKKKFIAILLILLLSTPISLFCSGTDFLEYEDYSLDEFPTWTYKARRGESLFFGSLAITLPLSILAYNTAVNTSLISSPSNDDFTNFTYQLSIAAVLSLTIALGDYIIGEFE